MKRNLGIASRVIALIVMMMGAICLVTIVVRLGILIGEYLWLKL